MSKTAPKSQLKSYASARKPLSFRRKLFLGAIWTVWALLLCAAVALAYGWTQRYVYLERGAKYILAESGIAADLTIADADATGLRLTKVTLRDDVTQAVFFAAEEVQARYQWRQALNGHIDYLKFKKPQITIELDSAGRRVGGWQPPSQSDASGAIVLPKDGIHMDGGVLHLKTPYGRAALAMEAAVFGLDRFDLALDLPPTDLAYDAMGARLTGPMMLSAHDGQYDAAFNFTLNRINTAQVTGESGVLEGKVQLVKTDNNWRIRGPIDVAFERLNSDALAIRGLKMTTQNDIIVPLKPQLEALKIPGNFVYSGDLDIIAADFSIEDNVMREQLAARLSLTDALLKSPILRDFAPRLNQQVDDRLSGQSIEAALSLNFDGERAQLLATTPLKLIKEQQSWTLSAVEDAPLLSVERQRGDSQIQDQAEVQYKANAQFNFTKAGVLPLSLTDGRAEFPLTSGFALGDALDFSAHIALPAHWQNQQNGGALTKLSAADTAVNVIRRDNKMQFTAETGFTLSGVVPGGYVDAVAGQGRLEITTQADDSHMIYRPRGETKFARLDLDSGWILENGVFHLSKPFQMKGNMARRVIDLQAAAVRARVHDGDVRDFQLAIETSEGQGVLELADDELSQTWNMTLSGTQIKSETFPVSETNVISPLAQVMVWMRPDAAPEFDIRSPQTRIGSSLVSAQQIAVAAIGNTDEHTIDYDASRFIFSDPALPEIPMLGQTRFKEGRWTGESTARLPEDLETPIDIKFDYENGVGNADINIAALQFSPGKLQPQNLVSALRGKIGNVQGAVSTSIQLGFGEGLPLRSSGRAVLEGLNFGTLPGPVQGLNASLDFTSMFPLETSGRQIVRLGSFDPGFPLKEGEIDFELLPGAMKIYRAEWPTAGGRIYIEPLTWSFTANENKAVLALENIPIQNMIKREKEAKFEMSGAISGRLPITVNGVNVTVADGKLSVPGGGFIRLKAPETDIAGAQNQGVGTAFDALKNFQYESLEAEINGALDGLVRLQAIFSGFNEDVYNRQPFEFDLDLEGELFNLIRELNPETQRKRAISGQLRLTEPPIPRDDIR